ncbi:MAG TPA: hypothetical protein VGC91_08335 [Pyrinomonadaceae bacterium]|jgi:hypothetical protein
MTTTEHKRLPASIFASQNRGRLIDITIFLVNIFLMRLLVNLFLNISRQASAGDAFAGVGLLLFYLGLLILPTVGAILKRWHFHQRIKKQGAEKNDANWLPLGCIFLPFAYLAVNLFITLAVSLTLLDLFPDSDLSGAFLLVGIPYNIFQTVIVFRYFSPPKRKPKSRFLRDPHSEALGDACIFLNMIFCQILLVWGAMTFPGFHEGKFVDRFIPLTVFALLMYLTGRIFFLAEDVRHRRTWLTILLANSVLILRVVFSTASNTL